MPTEEQGPPPGADRLATARAVLEQAERAARAAETVRPGESGGSRRDRHRGGRAAAGTGSPGGRVHDDPDPVDHGVEEHERARQIVLRQLTTAARSRAQLAAKLQEKGIGEDVAASVLDRMAQVGLVDDQAYAGMLVRSQVMSRGLARRGLAHELRTKGIDPELAAEALEQIDPEQERATARALVEKRLRTMGALDDQVRTRRLAGLLARKGYPAGLAYAVIREALAGGEGADPT